MSRDSSRTYIHLLSPHHADLFEDFTAPPSSRNTSFSQSGPAATTAAFAAPTIPFTTSTAPPNLLSPAPLGNAPASTLTSASYAASASGAAPFSSSAAFPPEDILIPLHLLPPNPEDEDDVVPDQHAAFGIARALNGRGAGAHGASDRWRDFESLRERVRGLELREGVEGGGLHAGSGGGDGGVTGGGLARRLGADGVGMTPTSRAREGRR